MLSRPQCYIGNKFCLNDALRQKHWRHYNQFARFVVLDTVQIVGFQKGRDAIEVNFRQRLAPQQRAQVQRDGQAGAVGVQPIDGIADALGGAVSQFESS